MTTIALTIVLACAPDAGAAAVTAAKPIEIKLWPGEPPFEEGKPVGPETSQMRMQGDKTVVSLTNVSVPALFVYPAPREIATGAAAVILPGGGYHHLDWTEEGEEVAAWLNSIGITAAVVKYRVPQREGTSFQTAPPMALADAQRAIGLVRSRADEWGVDRAKVGVIGFSAGGHLAAWVSTFGDARPYERQDAADDEPCTPNYAVILYPYGIINFDSQRFDPELKVSKATPPTFLVVASDDGFCVQNAVAYYRKLVRKKIPAELHAFETGGHSFALRRTGTPSADWPRRCEEWMRGRGLCWAEGTPRSGCRSDNR